MIKKMGMSFGQEKYRINFATRADEDSRKKRRTQIKAIVFNVLPPK